MTSGFNNAIVDGNGNLLISDVQSPDYSAGTDGWKISQDGSAEFNNVQIRGNLVIGTTDEGVFVYDGTPADGNLIAAIAASDGTDPYGNTYVKGFNLPVITSPGATGSLQLGGINSDGGNPAISYVHNATKNYLSILGPLFLTEIDMNRDGSMYVNAEKITLDTSLPGNLGVLIGDPSSTPVNMLQHGSFVANFAAQSAVSGILNFPNAFPTTPHLQGSTVVPGNLDVILNWQTVSPTQAQWRLFQRGLANITGAIAVHWQGMA